MSRSRPPDSWIVEGVMTTVASAEGTSTASRRLQGNIAPMGPIVDAGFERFIFRPFQTSTTYRNLKAMGQGVFHVIDDALLIARAAVSRVTADDVAVRPAEVVAGLVLTDACRAYELEVVELDDAEDRTWIEMHVRRVHRLRDFFGFNRARHAVLEAAILATRLHLTGPDPVLEEFDKLQIPVDKTGGPDERLAMEELRRFVGGWRSSDPSQAD